MGRDGSAGRGISYGRCCHSFALIRIYIGVAKEVTKANAALLQRYPFPTSRRTHPFPLRGNEKGQ